METNDELVDYLVERGYIETEVVEKAFRNVDRKSFVPESWRHQAYRDRPIPIDGDATISAPHMVAINTELLDLEGDERILEIGSGSGYQLAILSELGEEAIGVERKRKLVDNSSETLEEYENVMVVHGDGLKVFENGEVFDTILFSCGVDSLDRARKFLSENGVIVAPVNTGHGQVLRKYRDGETEDVTRVRFVKKKKGTD